jgi:hypothetical protein
MIFDRTGRSRFAALAVSVLAAASLAACADKVAPAPAPTPQSLAECIVGRWVSTSFEWETEPHAEMFDVPMEWSSDNVQTITFEGVTQRTDGVDTELDGWAKFFYTIEGNVVSYHDGYGSDTAGEYWAEASGQYTDTVTCAGDELSILGHYEEEETGYTEQWRVTATRE